MNEFAVGSKVVMRWAFTLRDLTPAELEAFLQGRGLPSGIGLDPETWMHELRRPQDDKVVVKSGGEVEHPGVGEFAVVAEVDRGGVFTWQARGETGGVGVAATGPQTFLGTGSQTL